MNTVPRNDDAWRETFDAHAHLDEPIPVGWIEETINTRLAQIRELANGLEQQIDWALDTDGRYSGEKDEATLRHGALHVLANLNQAQMHLTDFTGC